MDHKILKVLDDIFLIVGIMFLVYYVVITVYAGSATSFGWFWGLGGVGCILAAIVIRMIVNRGWIIPKVVGVGAAGLCLAGILVFVLVEGIIIYHANMEPEENADYVIVLGAQVRGSRITKSLKARLDTTIEYLEDNHETTVIVSGGKGPGEAVSEAEAMKGYLVKNGIPETQIIMEDRSTNTYQNILYSRKYMKGLDHNVVIVTNGFHIFRAVKLAQKQQIGHVEGLAAPTDRILLISYYVREVLAVLKDKLVGNI